MTNFVLQHKNLTLLIISLFFNIFLFAFAQQTPNTVPKAILLDIQGAIGPASQDYVHRGIDKAVLQKAQLIILRIDTPGGLDTSMRLIIKDILQSPIPIVAYVAPSGARAASAGTYIVYASHIAAMAPGTNLGAATPVQIGGGGVLPSNKEENKKPKTADTMTEKTTHDAIAYIRSLAKLRGRNEQWAEKAVSEAASLPAHEALAQHVIDIIAKDIPDLLTQINNRQVNVAGTTLTLSTQNMRVAELLPDWRSQILAVITDPSVAYILLLIGIYGLFFEFANPGFVVPGIVGGIALLLALYAFQLLPINYAGVALIILGIAFLATEAFMPTFGALGIGGIISFVAGSILLLDTDVEGFSINWLLIALMAFLTSLFFLAVAGLAFKSRRVRIVSGREEMLGLTGKAMEDFTKEGWIRIHGEVWKAHTKKPVKRDQIVRVSQIKGLTLIVEPIEEE